MTGERPDAAVSWTVVHPRADDGPATQSVEVLVSWLAEQPDVRLHTVLWLPGSASTATLEAAGTFHDVARDHRRVVPRALRRAGAGGLASRLTARAIRSTLRSVPRTGGLYLDGVAAAPALRYLPPGERRIVTHLHAADRTAAAAVPADHLGRLVEATHRWFAADEPTRDWAVATWGIDPDAVEVVGRFVDPTTWAAPAVPPDPDRLHLAIAGATWFRTDHTARLVQAILRLRPDLDLQLLWTEVEQDEHLAPLLHDLDLLGVRDRLHLPSSREELQERLREVTAIVLTTPDRVPPWRGGVPVVCFDSHPYASEIGGHAHGRVVEYLDLVGMAEAVIGLHDDIRTGVLRVGDPLGGASQDVRTVGPRLVELASGAGG